MTRCPSCSRETPPDSRFCPGCGGAIGSSSAAATVGPGGVSGGPTPTSSSSWTSSSSIDDGRFQAGTMLGERYRIVARLGKGGMGEVYRAEDLKLGQIVALKFLPEDVVGHEETLARFRHEVRIARQVSHPNVCRVYDIGEVDGHAYLSMEYVDGEDLRTLLKRIGRLPGDKVIQIARQLCAGLAAAHDKGVLHRDLKPANVMLDGEGRIRITDFGLAAIAGQVHGKEIRSGTPSYMAPEQLTGHEVSVASDIYSLGLVMFELFTGKPAFKASSLEELVRKHREDEPTSPSSLVDHIDPAAERVIMRCLSRRPAERPSSALAVAGALPGGDPLAAALAAGETPSPEVVAAAGVVGGLGPTVAWSCLAGIAAGLALIVAFSGPGTITGRTRLTERPEVLAAGARSLLKETGYQDSPRDASWTFAANTAYLDHLKESGAPDRWDRLDIGARSAMLFWYRQSPRLLVPFDRTWSQVSRTDPPLTIPGMAEVVTDPEGRLVEMRVVPPQRDDSPGSESQEPDWTTLLSRAGLVESNLTPMAPVWLPPVHSDTRVAWKGAFPGTPDGSLRVEGASFRGRPVFFRVLGDWNEPDRPEEEAQGTGQHAAQIISLVIFMSVIVGSVLLARRNMRLGRSDRKGAFRLAATFTAAHTAVWFMVSKYYADLSAFFTQTFLTLALEVFVGVMIYLAYLALEPYIRRRWPDTIISWTRVLSGRFRDPLVGRDILFGTLAGIGITLFSLAGQWIPVWLGLPPRQPDDVSMIMLMGGRWAFGEVLDQMVHGLQGAMLILVLFLIMNVILRREWIAAIFIALLFGFLSWAGGDYWFDSLLGVALASFLILAATRLGMLGATCLFFVLNLCSQTSFTPDVGAWHSTGMVLAILTIVGLAGYGFYTSLAGRPIFADALLLEGPRE